MAEETIKLRKPELVKNKYYRAEDVNPLLKNCGDVIRRLQEENEKQKKELASTKRRMEKLQKQWTELNNQRSEVSDAIVSSKIVGRQIITESKKEAERMVRSAKLESEKIIDSAHKRAVIIEEEARKNTEQMTAGNSNEMLLADEKILSHAAESYARLKKKQQTLLDAIDEEWQQLLAEAYGDSDPSFAPADSENTEESEDEYIPDDLSDKVSAIAMQLQLFGDDFDEEDKIITEDEIITE